MSSGTDVTGLGDQLLNQSVEYFSTSFPNPTREGCPHPERLRALASSAAPVRGPLRTHLFECSECFREFRRERLTVTAMTGTADPCTPGGTDRMRVHTMVSVAASVALATGLTALVFWLGIERTARQQMRAGAELVQPSASDGITSVTASRPRNESPMVVAVALQPSTARRGTSTAIESALSAISIRAGRVRFEIQLPDGSPDGGSYQLAIVDPFDKSLVETSASAVRRSLVVVLDATDLDSGRRFLRLQRAGEPPDYVPILVEAPVP
jgi:hypothetical protein